MEKKKIRTARQQAEFFALARFVSVAIVVAVVVVVALGIGWVAAQPGEGVDGRFCAGLSRDSFLIERRGTEAAPASCREASCISLSVPIEGTPEITRILHKARANRISQGVTDRSSAFVEATDCQSALGNCAWVGEPEVIHEGGQTIVKQTFMAWDWERPREARLEVWCRRGWFQNLIARP